MRFATYFALIALMGLLFSCEKETDEGQPGNSTGNNLPEGMFIGLFTNDSVQSLGMIDKKSGQVTFTSIADVSPWGSYVGNDVAFDKSQSVYCFIQDGGLLLSIDTKNKKRLLDTSTTGNFAAPVYSSGAFYVLRPLSNEEYELCEFNAVTGEIKPPLVNGIPIDYVLYTTSSTDGTNLYFLGADTISRFNLLTKTLTKFEVPGSETYFGIEATGNGQLLSVCYDESGAESKALLKRISISGNQVSITEVADLGLHDKRADVIPSLTFDTEKNTFYYAHNRASFQGNKITYIAAVNLTTNAVQLDSINANIQGIRVVK